MIEIFASMVIMLAPTPGEPGAEQVDIPSLVADLSGEDSDDRLYAARVLRSRLRTASRQANSRDDMIRLEARQALGDLRDQTGPACEGALEHQNVVRPCAEILATLNRTEALPALNAALSRETSGRRSRALKKAIEALESPPPVDVHG